MLNNPSSHQPTDDSLSEKSFSLAAALLRLDQQFESKSSILYKSRSFADAGVVGEFVAEHGSIRSAALGTSIFLYVDPCRCCIPAHGERTFERNMTEVGAITRYLRHARESGNPVELLFLSEKNYRELVGTVGEISPETKLIVGCDRQAPTSATDLRKQGIPAIDDFDYLESERLNAMIALVVFNEVVE